MDIIDRLRNDRTNAARLGVGALALLAILVGVAVDPLGVASSGPYLWTAVGLTLGGSFIRADRSVAGNVLAVTLTALGGTFVGFSQLGGGEPYGSYAVVGLGLLTAGLVYHVSDVAGDDDGGDAEGEDAPAARGG